MEYYLLWKVLLVIFLTDLMDLFNFKRKRNRGYFCINSNRNAFISGDGWHDTKKILLLFVFGEMVDWNLFLLVLAGVMNLIVHELLLYHGIFNIFNNHKEK